MMLGCEIPSNSGEPSHPSEDSPNSRPSGLGSWLSPLALVRYTTGAEDLDFEGQQGHATPI